MKNILLTLLLLAISSATFAQTNLVANGDFEDATNTAWYTNFGDNTPEIRTEGDNSFFFADVEAAGTAFSVNLSQLVTITPGATYTFTFDASSAGNGRTVVVGIGQSADPFYANVETATLTSESQTFTYELIAKDDGSGNDFGSASSRVIFDMGADTGIVVIDNVSLTLSEGGGGGGNTAEPTTAAPTPSGIDASGVISVFSGAFDNVGVTTFATDWSEGSVSDFVVEGDSVLEYDFTNFVGIQLDASVDLTSMTHIHMDYWVADQLSAGEVLNVKLSNHNGLPDTAGETDASELTNPVTTSREWVSLDTELSNFAVVFNSGALDKVYQIVISVSGTLDKVFIDNLYFYDAMSVNNEIKEIPNGFNLEQNYPNPFNPSTRIAYSIPASGEVTLEVYNIQGQKVATVVDGFKTAGSHTATFDAANLSSGIYVYRLTAGTNTQIKKMMLIK
ncbi:MAG: T9SS type A sorting domain-containing protein [Balneola sp.]